MKKGISPLVEGVFLVLIGLVAAAILAMWLPGMVTDTSNTIKNTSKTQLQCSFGNLYIKSATYDCLNNCSAGKNHNLTVKLVNSGKITVSVDKMAVMNTTGDIFALSLNETTTINPGTTATLTNISTATCDGINGSVELLSVNSIECPSNAFDSMSGSDVTFVNC
jgi:FlaG/FlaF family flagellin (archaellin)